MTAEAGFNGAVKVGSGSPSTIAEIGEWDLSIDSDVLKTTHFGDTWKRQVNGIKSWNGKASGRWDMTDTTGQVALQNAILGGTSVTINLATDASHTYVGVCWVKNISIKTVVDSTVDVDFTFEGTGALTWS